MGRDDTSPARREECASCRWRLNRLALFASIVVWSGMLVLGYPTASSWVSQYDQSKVIDQYEQQAESPQLRPPAAQQLAAAHRYNDALSSKAIVRPGQRIPSGEGSSTDPSLDYDNLLRVDASGLMGSIQIPSIGVNLPIYHGTDDATLLRGVGHLEGTSLPVGGVNTHTVLTGHRGLASATMFTHLDKVKVGDTFTITVLNQALVYKVISSVVVDPDQTQLLRPVAGKDLATLVTCTPLGVNTQRILVTGERVAVPAAGPKTGTRIPVPFPWWVIVLGGGTLLIAAYLWRSGYKR